MDRHMNTFCIDIEYHSVTVECIFLGLKHVKVTNVYVTICNHCYFKHFCNRPSYLRPCLAPLLFEAELLDPS